jgi:hypothetical protein
MSEEIGMTPKEVIADFHSTEYISFVEYMNDWYYEDEDEESNE